jgi:hypothetical protein
MAGKINGWLVNRCAQSLFRNLRMAACCDNDVPPGWSQLSGFSISSASAFAVPAPKAQAVREATLLCARRSRRVAPSLQFGDGYI